MRRRSRRGSCVRRLETAFYRISFRTLASIALGALLAALVLAPELIVDLILGALG